MKYLFLLCALVCQNVTWGQSFQYPIPPDTILDRQGRMDYMLTNFWNDETIADSTLFMSPSLLMDYLYLLKQSDDSVSLRNTKSFVSMACRKKTFGQILFWLDNILYDSSSPHYDEAFYSKVLNVVITCEADTVMKLMPAQRLEMMSKNQIGAKANNFTFVDKSGASQDLYSIDATFLLLIFNNPDCSICHQTEKSIVGNRELKSMIDKGQLTVLAITPDAEYNDWMNHQYPHNWVVGYDLSHSIYDKRLYDIQHLPSIYLLDREKRVLLKEADFKRLIIFLAEKGYNSQK